MLNMLLCNWPPVREVCPNYELVVFQPQTMTPPHLGSVVIITKFASRPPIPPGSTVFLDHSFPFSVLLPLHHQPFMFIVLFLFATAPHLLSRSRAPPTVEYVHYDFL